MTDVSPDPHIALNQRLLEGDPTAPADVAEELLQPLVTRLRHAFPNLAQDEVLLDSVVDAVLSYSERPGQFDPSKATLLGYLVMSAKGDVLNALARRRKRAVREVSLQVVEDSPRARKLISEHGHVASADDVVIERFESERLAKHIRAAARSPEDGRVLQLLVNGERRTERFAAVLGVDHLARAEQRRVVKQVKDRLKKRLERMGVQPDE